ncbi:unnamed protein product [Prunus armeniaca]
MDTKNRLSSKNKNQRLSSKIKYDALDKLNEELGYAPVFKEGTKSKCGSHGDMQLSNEKNNRDEEFEHDSNGYSDEISSLSCWRRLFGCCNPGYETSTN